jgi:hypothetical protein
MINLNSILEFILHTLNSILSGCLIYELIHYKNVSKKIMDIFIITGIILLVNK